jgi:transposase-like protein
MVDQTAAKRLLELGGRRKWSEEEGRFVVAAWEESGESVPTFARGAGLFPQRVYWWKERLGRGGEPARTAVVTASTSTFVPLTVRAEEPAPRGLSGAAVTVVVSSELRIEVAELDATSAAWVATLVKSLGEVEP